MQISADSSLADEPTIQMASPSLYMQSAEVIRGTVLRDGNTNDMTCVGWRTEDGTVQNGVHFVGGNGMIKINCMGDLDTSLKYTSMIMIGF